jgi:exopolysaccharide biosynthesis polyprenyl glycosylphosphotransferase
MTILVERGPMSRVVARGLQPSEHRVLLGMGDAAAAIAAVVAALWLWSVPAGATFSSAFIAERVLWFICAGVWFVAAAVPAAAPAVAFSIRRTVIVLGRGVAIFLLGYLALYFYSPRGARPRLVVLYFLWEALLFTLAWRLIFLAVFSRERFRNRTILVGSGPAALEAFRILRQHRARQYEVDGCVPDGTDASPLPDLPAIAAADLGPVMRQRGISELILALRTAPRGELLDSLLQCQESGASLVRMQTLYEQLLHRVPVEYLEPDWLMTDLADAVRIRDASGAGKRLVDVAGSIVGLAVLGVLGPIIATAIWLDSGGPVLFRQERVGRGGRVFRLIKFRTMARDAEQDGEARWADRRDPRVTRVGRLLRRARLDELPQFLCILYGDMSLVGPRPERPEFVERLQAAIPFYRARLVVPPGLTGWAQVNLPYGDTTDLARQKLEFDLYYVKHRSLGFDLRILLRTVGTMVRLRGH